MQAILARGGCGIVTEQNHMQDDVIVAGIAMVPMHDPVAGAYVKFDIADVPPRVRHVSYVLLQQRRRAWAAQNTASRTSGPAAPPGRPAKMS